jgi:hypothetical protein
MIAASENFLKINVINLLFSVFPTKFEWKKLEMLRISHFLKSNSGLISQLITQWYCGNWLIDISFGLEALRFSTENKKRCFLYNLE